MSAGDVEQELCVGGDELEPVGVIAVVLLVDAAKVAEGFLLGDFGEVKGEVLVEPEEGVVGDEVAPGGIHTDELAVEEDVVAFPVGLDVPGNDLIGGVEKDACGDLLAHDLAVAAFKPQSDGVEFVAEGWLHGIDGFHIVLKAPYVKKGESRCGDIDFRAVVVEGGDVFHGRLVRRLM